MGQDWLPSSDADFLAWLKNFLTYANANLAALGLVAADLAPLQATATEFEIKLANHTAAQAQALSARQAKDDSRDSADGLARPLVTRLQASPSMTDPHRQALGITVRSGTRTAAVAPSSRPLATIDTSHRLQHTISFVDEETPTSRAKPDGVSGCEIWVKIGTPPPADPVELSYLATDTASPYTATFNGADAGKTAYYMLRWINTRSERGPWSQTVSATITN